MSQSERYAKHDRIISDLIAALDYIHREADKPEASRHYIMGVCEGATKMANAERVRNSDGYLVVKVSDVYK